MVVFGWEYKGIRSCLWSIFFYNPWIALKHLPFPLRCLPVILCIMYSQHVMESMRHIFWFIEHTCALTSVCFCLFIYFRQHISTCSVLKRKGKKHLNTSLWTILHFTSFCFSKYLKMIYCCLIYLWLSLSKNLYWTAKFEIFLILFFSSCLLSNSLIFPFISTCLLRS